MMKYLEMNIKSNEVLQQRSRVAYTASGRSNRKGNILRVGNTYGYRLQDLLSYPDGEPDNNETNI